MSEKKRYKIQGVEVYQTELTLGQDLELVRLFRESGEVNWGDPVAIVDQVLNAGLLDRLVKIILRGEVDKIDVNEITNSELEAIVSDFLSLNGGVIGKFAELMKNLAQGSEEEK